MSRLILHIGTHKTATTRLQELFRRNTALLSRHGIIYPQIGPAAGQHVLAGVWNALLRPEPGADIRGRWHQLRDNYAGGTHTVLLSSEELSRMNRRMDLADLRRLTEGFDSVEVLCSLRNQADFLQSVTLQISARRPPRDWDTFFERAMRTRMADGLTLDYNRFYSHLLTGFARTEIRLISYDAAVREEGGIVGAYLRALGLPLTPADLAAVPDAEANISPPPLAGWTAARLARPGPTPPGLIALMQQQIAARFGPELRSTLFTRAELARIEALFSPMNAALAHRLTPYQPELRIAARSERIPDLYRDDLDDGFWLAVCRQLNRSSATA